MSNTTYTTSKKTEDQRRSAARKTGENATTSDASEETVLSSTFDPFPDAEEDPAQSFMEALEAISKGESGPYDEIEAALVTLLKVNVHAVAAGGTVVQSEDGHLSLNLQLIALEKVQACFKSYRNARGQAKQKKGKRAVSAMQKKLAKKHAQRTMQEPVN